MSEFKPMDLFDEETGQPAEKEQPVINEQVPSEQTVCDDTIRESDAHEEETSSETTSPDDFSGTIEDPAIESEDRPTLEQVLEATHCISEQVAALADTFNTKIMHSAHEEKIVDQMHKELQRYKEDMYAQLVRPILLDVIEVRDSIMRVSAAYRAKSEGEQDIPNKTFADYAYDLQDILEKNNVEIYRSQAGDDFTPIKQRAVKKVSTPDQSLHGKIAESISCGYSYNGRTISAEKVSIYYYEKPAENDEKSEVIDNG